MVKIKRPVRFVLSIMIILCFLALGSMGLIDLFGRLLGSKTIKLEKITTIDYENDEKILVKDFNNDILTYNKDMVRLYTSHGKEKWKIQREITNPIIENSEKILFIGDSDIGKLDAFDEQGNLLWSYELNHSIKNFLCNSKGYIALYTDNLEDGEGVILINPKGEEEGRIFISKGNILGMDLSENEDMVALSIMNTEDNKIQTNVILYSLKGKLLGANKYEDQIISNIFFNKENKIFNVGNKRLMAFQKEKGLLWNKNLSYSLGRIAWNDEGFIVLNKINEKSDISNIKDESYISIMDMKGHQRENISVKGEVKGMDTKGNLIVVFTDRTIYLISKNGELLIEKKIMSDIQGIHILSNEEFIVVLKDKFQIMEVRDKK